MHLVPDHRHRDDGFKHSAFTAVLTFCLTPVGPLPVVWWRKSAVPDQFEALMDLRER